MRYPKINTLWKRDLSPGVKCAPIIVGEYSDPEFAYVTTWHVEEKAEGMHVRVIYSLNGIIPDIQFKGRQEVSVLPQHIEQYMGIVFTSDKLIKLLKRPQDKIVLHMEAIGYKIQGDYYNLGEDNNEFVLFDVVYNGQLLEREYVYNVAHNLDIKWPGCITGVTRESDIIDLVKSKPLSDISQYSYVPIEGVVCRGEAWKDGVFLGNKIMKLKCRDYKE